MSAPRNQASRDSADPADLSLMTGAQLRKFLLDRGVSQREAAEWLDVSLRHIQRACAGQAVPRIIELAVKQAVQVMGRDTPKR